MSDEYEFIVHNFYNYTLAKEHYKQQTNEQEG